MSCWVISRLYLSFYTGRTLPSGATTARGILRFLLLRICTTSAMRWPSFSLLAYIWHVSPTIQCEAVEALLVPARRERKLRGCKVIFLTVEQLWAPVQDHSINTWVFWKFSLFLLPNKWPTSYAVLMTCDRVCIFLKNEALESVVCPFYYLLVFSECSVPEWVNARHRVAILVWGNICLSLLKEKNTLELIPRETGRIRVWRQL